MATKTISLELDAYEKLKRAKRGTESFSAVVRRARFDTGENTGERILQETASLYRKGLGVTRKELTYWDEAHSADSTEPRISDSPWDRRDP